MTKKSAKTKSTTTPRERDRLPLKTRVVVLTESGYRCAIPTCRNILALDMHHIWEVSAGGGDDPSNLIALCPTCDALYHRGTIKQESIYVYKSMLMVDASEGRAFEETRLVIVTLAEGDITHLHIGFKGTMNALFLKELAEKTNRGPRGRIEDGKSAGGLCYGYRVVRTLSGGTVTTGEREIEPSAAAVERIFRDFIAGTIRRNRSRRI